MCVCAGVVFFIFFPATDRPKLLEEGTSTANQRRISLRYNHKKMITKPISTPTRKTSFHDLYATLNDVWETAAKRMSLPSHLIVDEQTFASTIRAILQQKCSEIQFKSPPTTSVTEGLSEEQKEALPPELKLLIEQIQGPANAGVMHLNRYKYFQGLISKELKQLMGLSFTKVLNLKPGSPFGETNIYAHVMITEGLKRIFSHWGAFSGNPLTLFPTNVLTPEWMVFYSASCTQTMIPLHHVVSSAFALASNFMEGVVWNKYWTFMEVALIECLNEITSSMASNPSVKDQQQHTTRRMFPPSALEALPENLRNWFQSSHSGEKKKEENEEAPTFETKKERLHYIVLKDFFKELLKKHAKHLERLKTIATQQLPPLKHTEHVSLEGLEIHTKEKLLQRVSSIKKPMVFTDRNRTGKSKKSKKEKQGVDSRDFVQEQVTKSKSTRRVWSELVLKSLPYPPTEECGVMLENIEQILQESSDKLSADWVTQCLGSLYKKTVLNHPEKTDSFYQKFRGELESYQSELLNLLEIFVFVTSNLTDEANVENLTNDRKSYGQGADKPQPYRLASYARILLSRYLNVFVMELDLQKLISKTEQLSLEEPNGGGGGDGGCDLKEDEKKALGMTYHGLKIEEVNLLNSIIKDIFHNNPHLSLHHNKKEEEKPHTLVYSLSDELNNAKRMLGYDERFENEYPSQEDKLSNLFEKYGVAPKEEEGEEKLDKDSSLAVVTNEQHPYWYNLFLIMMLEFIQADSKLSESSAASDGDGDGDEPTVSATGKIFAKAYLAHIIQWDHQDWATEFVSGVLKENALTIHGVNNHVKLVKILQKESESLLEGDLSYLRDISFNSSYLEAKQCSWCKQHCWDIMAILQLNRRQEFTKGRFTKKQGKNSKEVTTQQNDPLIPTSYTKESDHTLLAPKNHEDDIYIIDDVDNVILLLEGWKKQEKQLTTGNRELWLYMYQRALKTQQSFEEVNIKHNIVYDY